MSTFSAASDAWELFFVLGSNKGLTGVDVHKIDGLLADKLTDVDSIVELHHQFVWNGVYHTKLPKTKNKLNEILATTTDGNFPNWFISSLSLWLDSSATASLLNKWLDSDDDPDFDMNWLLRQAEEDNDLYLKIFKKLVRTYKVNKSQNKVQQITNLFGQLSPNYLDEACEALAKSTPAVTACLLSRNDISEEYTIKGLKALSKLSKQRKVDIELDFEMLAKLGPKARLDAMKQLLGLFTKWYSKKPQNIPFKTMPTREDVANFLFPCSIKYNKEVTDVMNRFDEIIKSTK